jgi:hypothetical protein
MSARQPCIPGAPFGPVAARISRRTSVGRTSAISCATKPPIENPSRSTRSRPSPVMNAIMCRAVSAIVLLGSLVDAPTPG